jgi:hypothetical protein
MDIRIPASTTAWQLWHTDTFDRDSSASLQASGEDLLRGLYELWFYTLKEGIQDNGSASFSYFHLMWGDAPSARMDVSVQPFHNSALLKLRHWTHFSDLDQNQSLGTDPYLQEQRLAVLNRLARLHYDLLLKSTRWHAAAIDWSAEARQLLARVESMTTPEEL